MLGYSDCLHRLHNPVPVWKLNVESNSNVLLRFALLMSDVHSRIGWSDVHTEN